MKILCNYREQIKEMYFDKIIFFHGNHKNLHELYQGVLTGLNGQDRSFLLNNQMIEKKQLNVIEFDNQGIIDDLKFTSKSYIGKLLHDEIQKECFESISNDYDLINKKLNILVQQSFSNLCDKYMFINPDLSNFSIERYIQNNISFVDKEKINFALNSELQLCIILEFIKNHPNKIYHVLIKDFERNLDFSQILYLLDIMENITNASFYIFLKCFEIYEEYLNFEQYLVLDDSIIHRIEDEQECTYSPLLTTEENKYYMKSITYLKHKKVYDKYTSQHPEIFKSSINNVI